MPPALQWGNVGPDVTRGIQNIGQLLQNPGGLSPNVADAINPRLAAESQNIAANFRGIGSNQAGAAARGNLPTSIKAALSSALDIAQERAQRGARGEALQQSETLRRQDMSQVYDLLNSILGFLSSARGSAAQTLGTVSAAQSQNQAANLELYSRLADSLSKMNFGGNNSGFGSPGSHGGQDVHG